MTRREGAILGAYTGLLLGDWGDLHGYAEELLGRPVFSHEFATDKLCKELKEKSKKDFEYLMKHQEGEKL